MAFWCWSRDALRQRFYLPIACVLSQKFVEIMAFVFRRSWSAVPAGLENQQAMFPGAYELG